MGLRFRKSIKICKGVRLNFNKSSFGFSIGGKGSKYTINSKGMRRAHFGIPGTGLSYGASFGGKRRSSSSTSKRVVSTKINLHMSDDGKMSFYYSNGKEITDPSLINKIKRTPDYRLEKARMQTEHDKEMLSEINAYNQQNEDLINIHKLSAVPIHDFAFYENELNRVTLRKYNKRIYNVPIPTRDTVYEELIRESKNVIKGGTF